jgi:hypothetical protein
MIAVARVRDEAMNCRRASPRQAIAMRFARRDCIHSCVTGDRIYRAVIGRARRASAKRELPPWLRSPDMARALL